MLENTPIPEETPVSLVQKTTEIPESLESKTEGTKINVSEIIEFFRDLVIIFIVVIFVRTFIAAPFQISGSSMEDSYHDREFILVNKFSYVDTLVTKADETKGNIIGAKILNLITVIIPRIVIGNPVR